MNVHVFHNLIFSNKFGFILLTSFSYIMLSVVVLNVIMRSVITMGVVIIMLKMLVASSGTNAANLCYSVNDHFLVII